MPPTPRRIARPLMPPRIAEPLGESLFSCEGPPDFRTGFSSPRTTCKLTRAIGSHAVSWPQGARERVWHRPSTQQPGRADDASLVALRIQPSVELAATRIGDPLPAIVGVRHEPLVHVGRGECQSVKRGHLGWQPEVGQVDLDPTRLRLDAGRPGWCGAIAQVCVHDLWMLNPPASFV